MKKYISLINRIQEQKTVIKIRIESGKVVSYREVEYLLKVYNDLDKTMKQTMFIMNNRVFIKQE